jgi:hypothetical protein
MRAELPRRGGLPIKRAREIASGTDGLWTLLWRRESAANSSLEQAHVGGQMTRGPRDYIKKLGINPMHPPTKGICEQRKNGHR